MQLTSLPLETIQAILDTCEKHDLTALACVSSSLQVLSERNLYREIDIIAHPRCARLHQTLATCSRRALYVRSFVMGWSGPDLSHASKVLMAQALRNMTGLTKLYLHLPGPNSWMLENCTFQLDEFSSWVEFDEGLVAWLSLHGDTITTIRLSTPGSFIVQPTLPIEVLPNLKSFRGHAEIAQLVVPGRKVESVKLSRANRLVQRVLPWLAESKGPLRILDTTFYNDEHLLYILEEAPAFIPSLERLVVTSVATTTLDDDTLEGIGPLLSKFKQLKALEFHSVYNDVGTVQDVNGTAKSWRAFCPTLQSIKFMSGQSWTQNQSL